MDPLTENRELENRNYYKPWYKRSIFYILIVLFLIILYYGYQFGLAYNTISIENGTDQSVWGRINNLFDNNTKEETPDLNPMPKSEPDRLDVLLLGIRGNNEEAIEDAGGLLTDTIMIISIDKTTRKTAIISIPRDLYIEMEIKAANDKKINIKGKINEVYERGLANGGGIALAKQIISRISGVYIDHAVIADFNAFREVVDSLGGIDIHLAKPFNEKTQWGYEFSLPAGDNHLNGDQALYYVRSRYSTNDFDRARRQQEVLSIIKSKALSLGFLSNPIKVTSLLADLKENIRTDFQIWDIKSLLALANSFGPKTTTKNYVITTENLVYETKTEKGEYILLSKEANYQGIKNLFGNILIQ
ncbi:MAG: LCP family protein [Patescibacteria group bacterium]